MRIINTVKSSKLKAQSSKIQIAVLTFTFFLLPLFSGCSKRCELNEPQNLIEQSQNYYQRAIDEYRNLIAKGKDLDRLHFELGKIYYSHGDFDLAIKEFKESNLAEAKKFLGISYYRAGNFVDALDVFNRTKSSDDEFLYYQALTSEKLNLFDQALALYKKIKDVKFVLKAKEYIEAIEKQARPVHIKDIDPRIHKILMQAPSPKKYPQAGALILLVDEKIEITPEGTQISEMHYLVKILNERGKENFSESHIDYDSTYEKVELEYARTIRPDGTIADVGSRHIRDVSKYLNFPLYSNARVFIISFPEIAEGAVVDYKLKIYRNQLINKKDFVLHYPVQASEPIISALFNLNLPKDRILHTKLINSQFNNFGALLSAKISEKEGCVIFSWSFKDIPQIIPESDMPPEVEINPTLLLSSFNNWQEIYDWWWPLAKDKIKADSAIKDKVKELIRGKLLQEAKVRAIYNFCAQKIRYVAVEYGQAGYEPHYAADIFKNKYGDCKDQAILLVTMLKEAGFEAWPVLIATKEYLNLNSDFPAMLFNHCIAAVLLVDKTIFLDPTAETCAFDDLPSGDQQRKVLSIKDKGYEIQDTPLYPAEHNLLKQYLEVKINEDESIAAKKSVFVFGLYDQAQRYWLLYTPPDLIEDTLQEKIQVVSIGAKLGKYAIENLNDLNKPVVLDYTFSGPEYCIPAGSLRILPQLGSLDTSLVAKDKRKYGLDSNILTYTETVFVIEIPDNFAIRYIPENITKESRWLKFSAQYSRKGKFICFRQAVASKEKCVSQKDYPEFKNFYESLAQQIKQRVVLERIK